jgi:hypothetical protein
MQRQLMQQPAGGGVPFWQSMHGDERMDSAGIAVVGLSDVRVFKSFEGHRDLFVRQTLHRTVSRTTRKG